jgi:hypothetical protein
MSMIYRAILVAALTAVALSQEHSFTVGDTRITALSETLIRIEPKGPNGFEDGNTFVAVARSSFAGVKLSKLNSSASGTWLATTDLHIFVPDSTGTQLACGVNISGNIDAQSPIRSQSYPNGTKSNTAAKCCSLCVGAADCLSWVFNPDGGKATADCWPLKSNSGTNTHPKTKQTRVFGQLRGYSGAIVARASDGVTLYSDMTSSPSNLLHWPSPLEQNVYALVDSPRFTVPEWGPTPIPPNATVDPALKPTNGYDFRNNVAGDIYVFVLGSDKASKFDLASWYDSRAEFLQLTGPTPLLPDWAYGSWYTWYIPYTEEEAKEDAGNWTAGKYPLDVWALDMEWRDHTYNDSKHLPPSESCRSQTHASPLCQDHYYNAPNTTLFPGLGGANSSTAEWFDWLHAQGLKTYFNDHPFPLAMQATPEEVQFRFDGLSTWIKRGLDYWW